MGQNMGKGHFRKKELNLLSLRTKECDGVQGTGPEHNIYVEETQKQG